MNRLSALSLSAGALVAALALAGGAAAQHPAPTPQPSQSANMQGDDAAWRRDPHMRAFYDLTVAATAQGPAKFDVEAYEQKDYAIFRDFGPAMHMTPDQMQDHLKLIPRQMLGIVKDDPHVLDSMDNFVLALFGPK